MSGWLRGLLLIVVCHGHDMLLTYDCGHYYTHIEFGSPRQTFLALVDTDSANTWVDSVDCDNCQGTKRFDCSKSPTCRSLGHSNKIQYVGGYISGEQKMDACVVGGLKLNLTEFTGVEHESGMDYEAYIGLGPMDTAVGWPTPTPILSNMANNGLIESNSFGLYLPKNVSQYAVATLGGVDGAFYSGDIHYVPSMHKRIGWNLEVGIQLGDHLIADDTTIAITTGSDSMYAPQEQLEEIIRTVDVKRDCSNIDELPSLVFKLTDGFELTLPAEFYVRKMHLPNRPSRCDLNIGPGMYNGGWILGGSFMRAFYIAFDLDNKHIGFAAPKN